MKLDSKAIINALIQIVLISVAAYLITYSLPIRGIFIGEPYIPAAYSHSLLVGVSAYGIHYLFKKYYN